MKNKIKTYRIDGIEDSQIKSSLVYEIESHSVGEELKKEAFALVKYVYGFKDMSNWSLKLTEIKTQEEADKLLQDTIFI
jgi:hypothetical protein